MSSTSKKELLSKLQQVQNVLNEPLTGKSVMVPMTTRAFFKGTLRPTMDAATQQEEQVLVRMGEENLVEMDRYEARDFFNKRSELLREQKTVPISSPPAAKPDSTTPTTQPTGLPFFEIREEYDDQGREVRGEAINVMKELEYLQKKESGEGVGKSTRSMYNESALPVQESQEDIERPKMVSDQEYSRLSSRLDELARMEEEADVKRKSNQISAKKLQSKGWTKGFLTGNKKKSSSSKKKKPQKASAGTAIQLEKKPPSERKVGFQKQDQIREIPRVGTRSAADLKPPAPRKPSIESDVFNGVVRERMPGSGQQTVASKPATRKKLSRFAQERQEMG